MRRIKSRLDSVSPSMCLAKWLQVSLHLTTGKTHSCYHPPTHDIDLKELALKPSALHNTAQKRRERAQMLKGERPEGCSYCWRIEDTSDHSSDRHYRSSELWSENRFQEVILGGSDYDVIPSYVEVNFNQACQFKCSYCYPHLSTSWMEEARKYGPWPTIKPIHDIQGLKKAGLLPIPQNEKNPYVEAFWKWWPELYPQLKVFRMTGGEPLIDHNTYRVLDYISEHPHPDLKLSITSNLCPPKKMMSRFQRNLKDILNNKKIFQFMLFPSIDTWGAQAEYIRFGLSVEEFEKNVRSLIKEIPQIFISFIVTSNALSLFSLKAFLEKVLEWQKEDAHLHKSRSPRLAIDFPCLRTPRWQAVDILPEGLAARFLRPCLRFMEKNRVEFSKGMRYGFSNREINKMRRLIDMSKIPINKERQKLDRINFYKFFSEHDRRRNTNFLETFPELRGFWRRCGALAKEWDKSQKTSPPKNLAAKKP